MKREWGRDKQRETERWRDGSTRKRKTNVELTVWQQGQIGKSA